MSFMLANGWTCQFLEEDLKTPLPRKLTLDRPAKRVELAQRGGYSMHLEGWQALERAIEVGRGGALARADRRAVREAKEGLIFSDVRSLPAPE